MREKHCIIAECYSFRNQQTRTEVLADGPNAYTFNSLEEANAFIRQHRDNIQRNAPAFTEVRSLKAIPATEARIHAPFVRM